MNLTIYNTFIADTGVGGINTLLGGSDGPPVVPGRIYYQVAEISRQNTPTAFDAYQDVQPCVLIKTGTRTNTGPQYVKAARLFVNLWFYQQRDTATINAAANRAYALLHETCLASAAGDDPMWWIEHVSDVTTDDEDETLRARIVRSQYVATIRRI
jgi:hypothetical protein